MGQPWEVGEDERGRRRPRHCIVHFGAGERPGLLLEWRPKRQVGGISAWEGLVIYADQNPATGDWTLTQAWLHGDLLRSPTQPRPSRRR